MGLEHLEQLRQDVEQGWVIEQSEGDLSLFKYHAKCMFKRGWTRSTRKARGIVLHNVTGAVVCRPFEKFFNLDEIKETERERIETQLVNCKYEITEKLDGSLISLWYYNGEWRTSTTGSLHSKQSEYALDMLNKLYPKFIELATTHTYVFEMVGVDWDRKIVKYNEERLVLLTAFVNSWVEQEECRSTVDVIATGCGFGRPRVISCYFADAADRKNIGKNEEGFVVNFFNKQRVKIKSLEYIRLHKLIGTFTPKNLIDIIRNGDLAIFSHLPSHLQERFDDLYATIMQIKKEIERDISIGWAIVEPTFILYDIVDYKACANIIKLFKPIDIQPILFARIRRKDCEDKLLWKTLICRVNNLCKM